MSLLHYIFSFILLVSLTGAVPLLKNVDVSENNEIIRADTKIDYRLPKNVLPSYYRIKLEPNIADTFNFSGESSIYITVEGNTTKIIYLHSKDLDYDETVTSLTTTSGQVFGKLVSQTKDKDRDFLILTFQDVIKSGKYILNLKYNGTLIHNDFNGFYRSSYKNDRGEEVWLATTQFEPTHARLAFPCFDEPAMKAQFDISIKHFDNYTAVSNMPAMSKIRDNDDISKWWTKFAVTPLMSSYLVAFIVSDFTFVSTPDAKFRVWSRDNAIHTGKFAHAIGQKELNELEVYSGIKHVIPKMDNFAIPQFRAGAMENWGIVTYRESALLFEENVTTTSSKEGIATVISHEFAHQWYGNLVSPLWWDYTWLNEGFANYFQYFITDKVEPTWRLMDQFVIKNLQATAFVADDNKDQHPMDATVYSPLEISKIFDSITYSKAGSVIRMFSHAFKESVFQDGLTKYLKKMEFKSATSDDLFSALLQAKGISKDVTKEALKTWSTQAGFPVVTVIRDYKTGTATITQKRFLTENQTEPRKESWIIPFNYAVQNTSLFADTTPDRWINEKVPATKIISGLKPTDWIIANKQHTGYYRVNYDKENWMLIAKYLNSGIKDTIHVLNRAQLLDDSFKLVQAGELEDHTVFLEISVHLVDEIDYIPWYTALRAFTALNKALVHTDNHNLFKLYIVRLIEKLEKTVGYTETAKDDHVTKLNRISAVNLACAMGSKTCLDATRKRLVEYINGQDKISTDLRSTVLCSGLRSADAKIWEATYNLTADGKKSADKTTILNALGCSSIKEKLRFYLDQTLVKDAKLTRGDVIKSVYTGNAAGVDVVFDFLFDNLKVIIEADGGTTSVENYFNELGNRMTTVAQINKLEKLIESLTNNDNKGLADALKTKALVRAKANIDWLKKYEPKIVTFLNAQKLVEEKAPTTETTGGSNVPLSTISLTALMIFITSLATRAHGF